MMSNTDFTKPIAAPTRDHPPRGALPGAVTYVVLAIWAGAVMLAITAGVFAGGGPSRLALPASVVIPIAVVAIVYRVSPRFRNYLLTLDLRVVLMAQLWRVIGVVFLFALAFDQLPAGFAVPAGVGDIATGIAASGVVLALGNGTLTRRRLYAFTALGVGRLPHRLRNRAGPRTSDPRRVAVGHLPHDHGAVLRSSPSCRRAPEPAQLGRPGPQLPHRKWRRGACPSRRRRRSHRTDAPPRVIRGRTGGRPVRLRPRSPSWSASRSCFMCPMRSLDVLRERG